MSPPCVRVMAVPPTQPVIAGTNNEQGYLKVLHIEQYK